MKTLANTSDLNSNTECLNVWVSKWTWLKEEFLWMAIIWIFWKIRLLLVASCFPFYLFLKWKYLFWERRKVLGELNAELNENFPLEFFQLILYFMKKPLTFLFCLLVSCPFPESISILCCSNELFNQSPKLKVSQFLEYFCYYDGWIWNTNL